jgi:hypothetical protein
MWLALFHVRMPHFARLAILFWLSWAFILVSTLP